MSACYESCHHWHRPPAGFTAVDVLALGALGHVLGVGIVLGLKATGK